MDNYIVLDLEWNQSPDGKEGEIAYFPFEIIELGAVRLDGNLKETGQFRGLVRPVAYPEMHYKISEVTHLNMEELLREGRTFEAVVNDFMEWCGRDYVFCTWGSMDLTELQRNMAYYGLEIPFQAPLLYYDIQKLYSIFNGDRKQRQSLDITVEELGLREERPFHRALNDAHYTGRVMAAMDFKRLKDFWSTDYYHPPENKAEEVYLVFPDYSKYISRPFESKEEAIADKTVTDLVCYRCKRMLRKKIRWFSTNQKFYLALGICPEHGFMKGKIRMKRRDDGRIYAVKIMKLVDEEEAGRIYGKKEEARLKRTDKLHRKRRKGMNPTED